jgi:hypothetical protein
MPRWMRSFQLRSIAENARGARRASLTVPEAGCEHGQAAPGQLVRELIADARGARGPYLPREPGNTLRPHQMRSAPGSIPSELLLRSGMHSS